MHRAPVVGVVVLDGHGVPLPEPLEVAHDLARSPDMQGLHHLLVISEEQFKVTHTLSFTPTQYTHHFIISCFTFIQLLLPPDFPAGLVS